MKKICKKLKINARKNNHSFIIPEITRSLIFATKMDWGVHTDQKPNQTSKSNKNMTERDIRYLPSSYVSNYLSAETDGLCRLLAITFELRFAMVTYGFLRELWKSTHLPSFHTCATHGGIISIWRGRTTILSWKPVSTSRSSRSELGDSSLWVHEPNPQ